MDMSIVYARGPAARGSSLLSSYVDLRDCSFAAGHGPNLFRYPARDLIAAGAVVHAALVLDGRPIGKSAVAALHWVLDDERNEVCLRGLMKRGPSIDSSVARIVTALAIAEAAARHGAHIGFRCQCRVYPDGRENEAAKRLFRDLGLVEGAVVTLPIKFTAADAHLAALAEPDGRSFRSRLMHSTEHTLGVASALLQHFDGESRRAA